MYLNIYPTRLISDVQHDFSAKFPFLKLEVFQKRTDPANNNKKIIAGNRRIGDVQAVLSGGSIEINDDMKVQELENIFRSEFGISTQVLRRSGNLWLQTTMTDNWTLGQQNEHGRELSITASKENEDMNGDYDLYRDADH